MGRNGLKRFVVNRSEDLPRDRRVESMPLIDHLRFYGETFAVRDYFGIMRTAHEEHCSEQRVSDVEAALGYLALDGDAVTEPARPVKVEAFLLSSHLSSQSEM